MNGLFLWNPRFRLPIARPRISGMKHLSCLFINLSRSDHPQLSTTRLLPLHDVINLQLKRRKRIPIRAVLLAAPHIPLNPSQTEISNRDLYRFANPKTRSASLAVATFK
jgi:hypothetical protein